MDGLKTGDRIEWNYYHHTNRKTNFLRTKHGVFIGPVRDRPFVFSTTRAIVRFDGNKTVSRVPVKDLRREAAA